MRIALVVLSVSVIASCTHTPPAETTPVPGPTAAASAAASPASIAPIQPNAAVAKAWDPALVALIGRATTMQAARVKMNQATDAFTFGPEVPADALARRAATAILTTPTDKKKRCGFNPGVAFRLCDEKKDCATVMICFECGDLAVQNGAKYTGMLDFQDSRGEFAAIAKAALPGDPEIQKL